MNYLNFETRFENMRGMRMRVNDWFVQSAELAVANLLN